MTSIFEGQPPKTRPKLQSKQGSFGFQVHYIGCFAMFEQRILVQVANVLKMPNSPAAILFQMFHRLWMIYV